MDPRLKKGVIYLSIAILLILFLPYLLTRPNFLGFDFSNTGAVGDTIGGILGPFIAIIAAVLTFAAFWVQYQANVLTISNFEKQLDISNVQRFENKFYDMIKLHIENVNSIIFQDYLGNKIIGKNAFKELFEELRYSFYLLKLEYINEYDDSKILRIAYYIYSFGIENNILLEEKSLNLSKERITEIKNLFLSEQIKIEKHFGDKKAYQPAFNIDKQEYSFFIRHKCFTGVMNILGNYYRNLFQTVKYVDKFRTDIQTLERKYNYVKTLRAQLSNYEQLLLYYNSLSKFGYPWLNDDEANPSPKNYIDGYLIKYKMIKNIPLPLASFGTEPETKFKQEIEILNNREPSEELFEWNEIMERN